MAAGVVWYAIPALKMLMDKTTLLYFTDKRFDMPHRRNFIKNSFLMTAGSLLFTPGKSYSFLGKKQAPSFTRTRPGQPRWPSPEEWQVLQKSLIGKLMKLEDPFSKCNHDSAKAAELFDSLNNPYFISDNPALTQTTGWLNAWQTRTSIYAVEAASARDVSSAVKFANKHHLRLVVKGSGHSYQGTSNAPDSLLIWTRHLNKIEMLDQFVAEGCQDSSAAPNSVVIVGAGANWMQVYNAVTTFHGRYVQGGGCATVGVAGLIQGGGFGSFSKKFGLAASGMLQAELVTAGGEILIVNEFNYPDLFWSIKGGGGGNFGIVTKVWLKTNPLPSYFGAVHAVIRAKTDDAFLNLIDVFLRFYSKNLNNEHWGEQVKLYGDNTLRISMVFQGLTKEEASSVWTEFQNLVEANSHEFYWQDQLSIVAIPAKFLWDPVFLRKHAPSLISSDKRPNAPPENIYWAGDGEESGQFLYSYHSYWLSEKLLNEGSRHKLSSTLFESSRYWTLSLHFNKGLSGSPAEVIEQARNTPMNPAVLDAFALAIIAGGTGPGMEGVKGHEPDKGMATMMAEKINQAAVKISKLQDSPASYISESDYFEMNWKQAFWGVHYHRLATIKRKYDPKCLFFTHHGVGSENWSPDGFSKL